MTRISEYNMQFLLQMFGYCQIADWLNKGHKDTRVGNYYRLTENSKVLGMSTLEFHGPEVITELNGFANHFGLSYHDYCTRTIHMLKRSIREKYIINVYEAIKNFSDHNKGKKLLVHLTQFDWFKMLQLLRRNASHFDNYGKEFNFSKEYPDVVTWGGITIRRGQLGHEIEYTDNYAVDLVGCCHEYLKNNQSIFE